MHPWLWTTPAVSTYGVCLVMAVVFGWLTARASAKRAGVDPSQVDLLVPLLILAGVGGAVVGGWLTDAVTPQPSHGLVLVGAIIASTFAGIVFGRAMIIPLGLLGDLFAVPMAIAVACGRVGCFCAGCCYGIRSPFDDFPLAIRFPPHSFAWFEQLRRGEIGMSAAASLPVYPVELYESAACVILALLLLWKAGVPGERFLTLAVAYSVVRFFVEFLRADNPPIAGPFTFSQVTCLLLIAVSAITWTLRRQAGAYTLSANAG